MPHRLIFGPNIPDDLVTALDYYEGIAEGLANRFRGQVNQRLDDIANRPQSFPFDVPPIRFARLERFPFLVFYVDKADFVSIVAILHGSSDPDGW